MKLTVHTKKIIADTITPVGLYLKLRDVYSHSFLLESSDYHGHDNNFSFLCFDPLASFKVTENIEIRTNNQTKTIEITKKEQVIDELQNFINSFQLNGDTSPINGVFGYTSYDSIHYFENINLKPQSKESIPYMHYSCFRFIVQIDHLKNELTIIENCKNGEATQLESFENLLKTAFQPTHHFKLTSNEESNLSDESFKKLVTLGKKHCQLGDVFQLVLSRQFSQSFVGDDFNVYRALRSINPSPYLFYFDFGSFKIFGSSPEAQLKIKENKATINPIAGTFKRTGNDMDDKELAEKLASDPKENSEHTMLVDLARNDLSKSGKNVTVKTYKQTQFYSHVIHLVSEVEADIKTEKTLQFFADTFPAGTLSGAPKYKALQLIDAYENQKRGFYGGAIGFFGFNNNINHAITIRSFLSRNNTLYYQAGAGIVVNSDENNELEEVNNKLRALKNALLLAEKLNDN